MASTSETGHAKNVENFNDLTARAIGFGTEYQPTNPLLSVAALQALYQSAAAALATVTATLTIYENAEDARAAAFDDIRTFSTQLLNGLGAAGASDRTVQNAEHYNDKIHGTRAIRPTPPDPNNPDASGPNSVSQQSYDQLIQHFSGLLSVLSAFPDYAPNEANLTIAAITTFRDRLNATNAAYSTAETNLLNARINRQSVLYNNPESLVPVAKNVKRYVKFVWKANSPQFKDVNSIRFRNIK